MFSPSKEALNQLIGDCLGENYRMVSSVSLQATHLVVFAHITIIPLITEVNYGDFATGFKKMMGNKGAVSVRFKLGQTSIRVINAHFHSGQNKVDVRNQDFNETYAHFCAPTLPKSKTNMVTPLPGPAKPSDDCLIFMGDFNYRINGNTGTIFELMKQDMYEILKYNDQLFIEMMIGKIPKVLKEGKVEFAPTYKRRQNSSTEFSLNR